MKATKLYLFFFLVASFSFAQNANRIFESVIQKKNHIEVNVNDGKYIITFYTSKIVETTFIPIGQDFKTESHAVVLKAKPSLKNLIETSNSVQLVSEGIIVTIQKAPFQISYSYKGKPIIII